MNQHLVEPSADRTAGLEEENERLRAENERLRGMLGLPPGAVPEAELEPARLFPEDDPLPRVGRRSPAQEKIALFRALFRGREDADSRSRQQEGQTSPEAERIDRTRAGIEVVNRCPPAPGACS